MALNLTAYHNPEDSTETRDLYEVLEGGVLEGEEGLSLDVWVKKGSKPTTMDIHIEFEESE